MRRRAIATERWPTVALALFLAAVSLALGCRAKRSPLASTGQSPGSGPDAVVPAPRPSPPYPVVTSVGVSRVVLGRVVALDGPRAVRTLADAPDQEVADVEHDVAVFLLEDSRLQGFRMSTGALLWERTTAAPCRKLLLARSKVYAGCGNKVFSFESTTGKEQVVNNGPAAGNPILVSGDGTVVVPGDRGRVTLYDSATGQLLVSKVVSEFSRAFQSDVLANPASAGICVVGLIAGAKNHLAYRAACYDQRLVRQWSKPFVFPGDRPVAVRQLGPEHLVLDDQESILDSSLPPGPGRGLVVHWRDGQAHPFDDKTFATMENAAGDRLQIDSDVFALTQTLAPADPVRFPIRLAKVVTNGDRSFAIIANGTTGLAGVDRSSGHVLFLSPISVGPVWTLDVAGGMPIVRSRFTDRWEVTIHDPATGSVRYRDSRPRVRTRPQ